MNRPRDELFADAALTLDEDGRLVVGDLRDRPEDVRHRRALRQDGLELTLFLDLLLERAVLTPERFALLGFRSARTISSGLNGLPT